MYTDEEIGKSVQCSLENNEFFEQNAYREKRVSNLNDYFRYLAHSLLWGGDRISSISIEFGKLAKINQPIS